MRAALVPFDAGGSWRFVSNGKGLNRPEVRGRPRLLGWGHGKERDGRQFFAAGAARAIGMARKRRGYHAARWAGSSSVAVKTAGRTSLAPWLGRRASIFSLFLAITPRGPDAKPSPAAAPVQSIRPCSAAAHQPNLSPGIQAIAASPRGWVTTARRSKSSCRWSWR